MASQYGITFFPVAALGAVVAELYAGGQNGFYLKSLTASNATANAAQILLRRTVGAAVTPTALVPGPYRVGDVPTSRGAQAWGTPPTAATGVVFAVINLPATIGASITYNFTIKGANDELRGIFVPKGTSLSFYSNLATGDPNISCILEEP